jgi:hypothetical protein
MVLPNFEERPMRQSIFPGIGAIGVMLAATLIATHHEAAAQRGTRGGGAAASGGAYRGSANANRSYNATASASRTSVNRSAQVNQNVNVNRNVNVDVDDYHGGHYGSGAGLAVVGAAAVTAAAVGSVAYSIPPSCTAVVSAGVTYQRCGNTWYQPQYAGTSVTYVVTNPPS